MMHKQNISTDEFYSKFEEKLNDSHNFPCQYTFKFILPASAGKTNIEELFKNKKYTISQNTSSKGSYISYTITTDMDSAIQVIDLYKKASQIKDLIAI